MRLLTTSDSFSRKKTGFVDRRIRRSAYAGLYTERVRLFAAHYKETYVTILKRCSKLPKHIETGYDIATATAAVAVS